MSEATQKGADAGRLCMALALNDGEDVDYALRLHDCLEGARESLSRSPVQSASDRLAFLATMHDDADLLLACVTAPADIALATRLRRMVRTLLQQASTESGLPCSMFGPTVHSFSQGNIDFGADVFAESGLARNQ